MTKDVEDFLNRKGEMLLGNYNIQSTRQTIANHFRACWSEDIIYKALTYFENNNRLGDYKVLAEFMSAIECENEEFLSLLKSEDAKLNGSLDLFRFHRGNQIENTCRLERSARFEDIFTESKNVRVYLWDGMYTKNLDQLFEALGSNIVQFIEAQHDLLGVNSFVRKGLMKEFCFEHKFVTKKDNPDKSGLFLIEQLNLQKISSRLGVLRNDSLFLGKDDFGRLITLKMIMPEAVISVNGREFYSIMPYIAGPTLEEELLRCMDIGRRRNYLRACKLILDAMYSVNILWGDMAPRNIILQEDEDRLVFYIFDFEKTTIYDRPILVKEIEAHCRGHMCVEEFGKPCFKDEVEQCFFPYWNPASWSVIDQNSIPYEKPKREIIDLMLGRGGQDFSFGEFNATEKEVMNVRFPFSEKNMVYYPSYSCYKISHYLNRDYDRKLTEIFLSAKKQGGFLKLLKEVESHLSKIDAIFISDDIDRIKQHLPTQGYKHQPAAYEQISEWVNTLYAKVMNKNFLLDGASVYWSACE